MAKQKETQKLIANNKKAYHDYFIEESRSEERRVGKECRL